MRKVNFTYSILALFAVMVMLIGCSQKPKTQAVVQEIPVIKAIKSDVPIFESYVGQIYGMKDIPIRARVDGFLETIEFQEGSQVSKAQLLYTIDPQSLEEASNAQRSKVTEAQTQLSKAKADLERIEPLAVVKAVSQSDLDAAKAAYDAAAANLEAAKANLRSSNINLGYSKVLSPISGIIGKTEAQVGEYVGKSPNPIILNTVSQIDSVLVKFSITEAQYIQFARRFISNTNIDRNKAKESGDIELQLADESIYKYKGHLDFIDRNIDQSTGSMLVQASFPNPDRLLRPGLYSKVKVQIDTKRDAIIIPQRCIMEMQGNFSVFVVTDSNIVTNRPIEIAYKTGDLATITKGLNEGDNVVIDALQKIRKGMTVKPVDSDFKSKVFNLENE